MKGKSLRMLSALPAASVVLIRPTARQRLSGGTVAEVET